MNTSGEAADQVVKMTLSGVEVAAKISGEGAKELAILLYAVMKDQKKTSGKTRLSGMIRSGKELKVFAVKDDELQKFAKEAKKYGILYCVLKDRDASDGITDVMVKAEDASKINRIFERFELSVVDIGEVKCELEKAVRETANKPAETAKEKAGKSPNPTSARETEGRSAHLSGTRQERANSSDQTYRKSVRKELELIRREQKSGKKVSVPVRVNTGKER